jgi:RNA polymerase sigma-70 factor, ECF subfamily
MDSDEHLVIMYCEGDKRAFEQLVLRHDQDLLDFTSRIVGPTDAQDVCQETWITAYKGMDGFNPSGKFTSWLKTIARNLAINSIREKKREISFLEKFEQHVSCNNFDIYQDLGFYPPYSAQDILTYINQRSLRDRRYEAFQQSKILEIKTRIISDILDMDLREVQSSIVYVRRHIRNEFYKRKV